MRANQCLLYPDMRTMTKPWTDDALDYERMNVSRPNRVCLSVQASDFLSERFNHFLHLEKTHNMSDSPINALVLLAIYDLYHFNPIKSNPIMRNHVLARNLVSKHVCVCVCTCLLAELLTSLHVMMPHSLPFSVTNTCCSLTTLMMQWAWQQHVSHAHMISKQQTQEHNYITCTMYIKTLQWQHDEFTWFKCA